MTLSHDSQGSGPAVLLLHSTICDRRMWQPQVPALLGAGFRVVRVDLPGFGDSPVPAGPANWATEVVEVLGGQPAALIGSSGGGHVALEIAARRPQQVTALALLCTAGRELTPGPGLKKLWARENELLDAGDVAGATELNVSSWLGPRAGDEARALTREMQRHAFEVQLASPEPDEIEAEYDLATITARSLLVSGEHDFPEFTDLAVTLAAKLPSAEHVHLEWAGHLPSMEDPPAVNELLLGFLAR